MIAFLKYGEKGYYCSNCRMMQKELNEQCDFCGANFTNYEVVLTEIYEKLQLESDRK